MSPIVLITGANQGIGFEIAKNLAANNKHRVIIGARSHEKGQKAAAAIIESDSSISPDTVTNVVVDVTSDASIHKAVQDVSGRFGKLDILINNAGINAAPRPTIRESLQEHFETNTFGVVSVTDAFLPLIRSSNYSDRRIVVVTSGLGSFTKATEPGPNNAEGAPYEFYRMTKAAVNMFVVVRAAALKREGIAVVAACPGHCATNLNDYAGAKKPSDGAAVIVRAAIGGNGMDLTGTPVAEEWDKW